MAARSSDRPDWSAVPTAVRARIAAATGVDVDAAEPVHDGFSVGFAGAVGTPPHRVFVKATSARLHADSARFHRREAEVLASLPRGVGPELLATVEHDDWFALVTEFLPGRSPRGAWRRDDLAAALDGMRRLSAHPAPPGLRDAAAGFTGDAGGWTRILDDEPALRALPSALRDRAGDLAALERAGIAAAVGGDALVHHDIRGDNLVLVDGTARFVDWPHAAHGVDWLDVVLFAPSVEMDGGATVDDVYRMRFGDAIPPEVALATAAWGARLWWMGHQPEPPELAGLRRFQLGQAAPALDWVARHLPLLGG